MIKYLIILLLAGCSVSKKDSIDLCKVECLKCDKLIFECKSNNSKDKARIVNYLIIGDLDE